MCRFPFSAVTGQYQFKLALLLAAINPLVSGVLISGPRGSAKSTLAKGLADIMPLQGKGRPPFVSLPLGASEEMLVGTLNLQQVINQQGVEFQPGLLAKAHDGLLYVDEVNLLPDNLVDQLLDVAASGINIIERDGISHQHEARFVLLGTMNPDEGELRPQLADRFGLSVRLTNQFSLAERVEVVRLRERFDRDPIRFCQQYQDKQQTLSLRIAKAKALLVHVNCDIHCRELIAQRCHDAHVEGLRADIVWVQAALAHAALEGRKSVTEKDVFAVEALVLNHRVNGSQPPNTPHSPSNSQTAEKESQHNTSTGHNATFPFSRPGTTKKVGKQNNDVSGNKESGEQAEGDWGAMDSCEQNQPIIDSLTLPEGVLNQSPGRKFSQNSVVGGSKKHRAYHNANKNSISRFDIRSGVTKKKWSSQQHGNSQTLNWFRTLIENGGHWPLKKLIFQDKQRCRELIHIILLDTSRSITSHKSFAAAKGLITQIAEYVYLQRQRMVMIGFGNQKVETLLNLKRAPKNLLTILSGINASGGTPLIDAIAHVVNFQSRWLKRAPDTRFKTYLITDGRVHQFSPDSLPKGDVVVVDVEQSPVKRGKARAIAETLNAEYYLVTI